LSVSNVTPPTVATKIAIRPQTRQLALQLRKLLPQGPATGAPDGLDQPMDTELWVTSDQQMHKVGHDFHLNKLLSPLLNGF
jgi:hypothetical protein